MSLLGRILGFILGIIVGIGLIWFSVYQIANFTPYCTPSATWDCIASVESQRTSLIIDTMIPLSFGVVVFLVCVVNLVSTIRDWNDYL